MNGGLFAGTAIRTNKAVVVSYDYTVLAGTQGTQNHRKKDRLFELAEQLRLPIVFFTEGGGGRPGDTDGLGVSGLDCLAFRWFGELSGTVPLVGVNAGYCFAGNAAILGCCDVVIATEDSNIGMGGPAMIEGGGLGVYEPEGDRPDRGAACERRGRHRRRRRGRGGGGGEAVPVVLPGCDRTNGLLHRPEWARDAVPVDRLRAYDMHRAVDAVFDVDSVLELRSEFGVGMITALARLEGRPVGVIANNPTHLAGAIDSDGADKAARFLQLCDAFGLPIITLVDTPGMMVGPEVEATALVRHCSRLFVTGANISVPMVSIVTAQGVRARRAGDDGRIDEGAAGVRGVADRRVRWHGARGRGPAGVSQGARGGDRRRGTRGACSERWSTGCTSTARRVSVATHFEIDDVIDPADTRRWISTLLGAAPETHWNAPGASDRPETPQHRHLVTGNLGPAGVRSPRASVWAVS